MALTLCETETDYIVTVYTWVTDIFIYNYTDVWTIDVFCTLM